jgi:N-acetylglucosamine-6-phosphate deacetylase
VTAIVDGVHLAPETAGSAWLAARERLCLITDAIAAAGMGDGTFMMGEREVHVAGGACRLADGTLAGSTVTMDRAIRELVALGATPAEAIGAATLAPARLLGRDDLGRLEPGLPADIAVLDDDLHVLRTLVGGTEVFAR